MRDRGFRYSLARGPVQIGFRSALGPDAPPGRAYISLQVVVTNLQTDRNAPGPSLTVAVIAPYNYLAIRPGTIIVPPLCTNFGPCDPRPATCADASPGLSGNSTHWLEESGRVPAGHCPLPLVSAAGLPVGGILGGDGLGPGLSHAFFFGTELPVLVDATAPSAITVVGKVNCVSSACPRRDEILDIPVRSALSREKPTASSSTTAHDPRAQGTPRVEGKGKAGWLQRCLRDSVELGFSTLEAISGATTATAAALAEPFTLGASTLAVVGGTTIAVHGTVNAAEHANSLFKKRCIG